MTESSLFANQPNDLSIQSLIRSGHQKPLTYIDGIFGGYCAILSIAALVAWLQGLGNFRSVFVFVAFSAINGIISMVSLRTLAPLRIELIRVIIGVVISPAAYLLAGDPFMRWWPGFLIMCLGGSIILGLITGSPRWGRLLVGYYLILMGLAEWAAPPPHNWYNFLVNVGTVAMVGLLFAELVSSLGQTLSAEREQRRQLALEKTKSESLLQKEAEAALRASEERFRTLVEISTDGIAIFDQAGRLRYASPAYEQLTGYTAAELAGRHFTELIHPAAGAEAGPDFMALLHNPGQVMTREYRLFRQDGAERIGEAIATRLPNGDLVAYNRDITDRKHLEEELRAREEQFRSLIENASDGIAVTDPAGQIVYVSPAYERIWGWTAEELLGQPFVPLIHPDDLPLAQASVVRLMTNPGEVGSSEIRVRHKDGSWRVIEGKGRALPNGNIISNVRDVTERRQIEDALRLAELRFRAVFEQPLLAVQIFNADGRIQQFNQMTRQMFEPAAEFTDSFNIREDPQTAALGLTPYLDRAFGGEATIFPPARYVFSEDQATWMQVFMYPVKDNSGMVREVVTIARDITAQQEAEEALRRLNEELEDRVAERSAQLGAAFAERTRLAEILEETSDMVAFATLDGRPLYLNRAGRRMIGFPADLDVTAVTFADFYPPDVLELFTTVGFPTALREGTWSGEVAVKHWADGHLIPVSIVGIMHYAPDGSPTHLSAIMRDISEPKRAQAELQQAKDAAETALAESRRLAAIIEATTDYVGIADLQGNTVYINQAGRQMIGLSDETYQQPRNVVDCYPTRELPKVQEMFEAMIQGEVWSGEMTLLHKDGQELPVSEVSFVLRDAEGQIEYLATIIRDIREQKRAEAELKQAKDAAEEARHAAEAANRAKSTFLANMSHELRTPLTAIIGYTELLQEDADEFGYTDLSPKLGRIHASGTHLLAVINDILDFSKIEAGKMELYLENFEVTSLINDLLLTAQPLVEKNGNRLQVHCAPNLGTMHADSTRLRQVLLNLLSNAAKFTENGTITLAVERETNSRKMRSGRRSPSQFPIPALV